MESEPDYKHGFTVRTLPWLVAGGALLVYALTLNPWMSLANLPQVGWVTGWTWQPELFSPAYFVATYPLRWLPTKWIPLGLNLFSALCAGLTLAQLARSVALLPHDRTHEQREREKSEHSLLTIRSAWLPPLLAALVCGLQLTFWENATNGTIETFDLLLFAWVIRALLEYRIDGRDSWLYRAALVYGVGMTNNFAMWGFLPVFIVALVWLRGMRFFQPRFLGRMVAFGLIGLSLYLLLPLLASISNVEPVNFWQALKANIGLQKDIIFSYPKLPTRGLDNPDWVILLVVCVLPTLLFSIRWPSYFGDTSQLGIRLATAIFHFMFGLYFCVCIWCLLDAPFSPRYHGFSFPFLTFYYLAALSVGYFCAYFLLVFRNRLVRGRLPPRPVRAVNRIVSTLVVLLAIAAPVTLVLKNLPNIHTTNGPIMKEYAAAMAEGLPKSGVLLSDDPRQLLLMQAWLAQIGRANDFLPIYTHMDAQNQGPLSWPAYHRYLHKRYPEKWEAMSDPKREQLFNITEVIGRLIKLGEKYDLCYLHPSFGYYFEFFYREPHGLTYWLKRYGPESLLPPPLPAEVVTENEQFWAKLSEQDLKPILATTVPRAPGHRGNLAEKVFKAAHLPIEPNAQATVIGSLYSRALNEWAVELQKQEELEKAAASFELAQKLNPENVVVQINQEYNKNLRAGQRAPLQLSKSMDELLGKYRRWDQALLEYGPYDEPGFCYAQGYTFMGNKLYRQAAQYFDRVRKLSPTDAASRMWLAQLDLMARLPDKTLDLTAELGSHPEVFSLSRTNRNELLALEARAHYAKNEPEKAVKTLESALDRSPNDEHLLVTALSVYFQNRQFSNALTTVNRLLKLTPDDPTLLVNKGVLSLQIDAFNDAIPPLTRALTLQTNNYTAQFYRAICYLRSDQLDAAQKDYLTLQQVYPKAYQVYYGLGEIAFRRKDTNAAIPYYEAYLTNASPNTEEALFVGKRLSELKGEKP